MAKARKRSSPLISALEPRMLLDGAALSEANQAITDTELQQTEPTEAAPPVDAPDTEQAAFEPVFAMSEDPAGQVIVVDASVPYADALLADVPPEWTVIRLDAGSDGLTQLMQALEGQQNLRAIHLFTHGSNGQIQLGSLTLTSDNMSSRQADLQKLGTFLTDSGDLMLYGCDVALDFVGQAFVSQLAAFTGADVAASDDATGHVVAGGDWELEYQAGQVDTAVLSNADYGDTLGTINMSTGLASGSGSINIGRYAPRLYWQASGTDGYDPNGTDARWVDQYTSDQKVSYWSSAWGSYSYPVPRWGWLPWTMHTVWFQYPVVAEWNYGSGTRYGVETVQLEKNSTYRFDVTTNVTYKDRNGQVLTNSGITSINTALYKGTFDPTNPLKNLVTASQGGGWYGNAGGALKLGELEAGTYQVVVSFDTNRWFVGVDNNVWWSSANNYAQQMWGNFTLKVTNLNQAPVWTARDLSQLLDGSDTKSFSIPWSLAGNQTLIDPDGDPLTVTATLSNGNPLPSWLTFNANNLSFTGNPPANTGTLSIRLTASDGQLSSTRDFTVTYSNDNDQPVVAEAIPDQTWDGAGSFSYTVPLGTFTDADPGVDTFTWSATLADGSPLPTWLSFNANTRVFSGNPPANFASLDVKVTANDGSGQANATQSDIFRLNLRNNNDVPTVSNRTAAINEDSTYSFSAADFVLNDADTHATNDTTSGSGKTLQFVRIISLPANGTLWLDADNDNVLDDGEAVTVNQTITLANLGKLRYTPNKDWAGAANALHDRSNSPDSFQWTASDGVNEAATPATTSITVTLVNDAPVLGFSDGRTLSVRPNTGNALGAVTVDAGLTLTDADAAYTSNTDYDTISKVTVSITEKVTGNFISGDTLAVTTATATANGISASYNSSTGVLTLTGNARAAQYQTVLRTLTFSSTNTSNDNIREVSMQLQAADVGTLSYANFDGVDDYIDTMQASLPVGADFTVSVWAQIASNVANGDYTILAQGNSADNFFIMLAKRDGDWRIRLGDNWAISNTFPSDGKWHQYTVTRTGTTGTLYIDGIKVGTGIMEASLPGTSLRIGKLYRQNDNLEYAGHWKGGISDVRVYNRVISTDEIATSLDRDAGLKGYEPNLVAWYPLVNDFQNKAAAFSWSLGRDFNPLNGDGTDGPWSVGVITGNAGATGNFNWGSFQAYTQANSAWTIQTDPRGSASDYIQLVHKDADAGNVTTGWARFFFPNGFDNVSSFTFSPGTVGMLPGHVNPAAIQFTAQVAGIYAVDARFWDAHPSTAAQLGSGWSSPSYKVFKVNAAGTSAVEISPGPVQTGDGTLPNSANARSAVQQVVLAAGERLVFAVHKGDSGGLNGDEMQAAIDVNLIATAVQAGGNTWYYNHATGHYIGLSTTTATWSNAQAAAGGMTLAGQTGYLSTATDANSLNIFRALMRDAGVSSVFAGGYQLATATDNATTGYRDGWFWSAGPRAGQLFDGRWANGEPNSSDQDVLAIHAPSGQYHLAAYDDGTASSSYRYLIEFGNGVLATPTELAAALSASVRPGNALVFVDAITAYSAATGHYYKLATSSGDFAAQQQAASSTQVQGSSGYLAQATTPDELALITRLARLNNSSGVWVGLQNVDTGNGVMDWKWVNANGSVAGNLDSSLYYQTAESIHPLETAGWTRVAYDGFDQGRTGWRFPETGNPVPLWYGQLMARNDNSNDPSYQIRKSFDINYKETVITFRFNRYDSWDNELFALAVQGSGSSILLFQQSYQSLTAVTAPVSGTVSGVKYTITPLANFGNFFGAGWNDQSFEVQIELPSNFGDTLTVTMDTNLDSWGSDETYGVDNFTLWQKNVPTNPGLGGTFEDFENGVRPGWDNANTENALYTEIVNVTRYGVSSDALWIRSWGPQKTYYIGNQATRVEFDFYALDSWDNEWFYTYINDVWFGFQRSTGVNYTDVVTGSMVVNGKPVTWSITPNNDYGNWTTSTGNTNAGHRDQSFKVVIDLPKNFGESFELKFWTNLDQDKTDESAAVDNVRVYSRENAGWLDPYTGVLRSDSTAPADPNGSFILNGQAGDYLDLGTISGLSGAYTLEGWVYADAANTWARIFDLGNGQESNNIFLGFYGDTGKIILSNRTNGNTYSEMVTTGTLPLGQWVHVAAVNNGNGTGKIYFNGVEQTTTTSNNYLSPGFNVDRTNSYAGRSNWAVDDYFRGQLSQLRIWNDARTQAEIDTGRAGSAYIDLTDPNLLGYWERVQLDASGKVDDLSTKNQDAWLVRIEDIVRLDQFASINLWHTRDNRWFTDDDWNPTAISTDGRFIYGYYGLNNWMIVFDMNGRIVTDYGVNSALGGNTAQMAYSNGWLYVRNANVSSSAADDSIRRVSPTDGSYTDVILDGSKPLLDGQFWAYGSLFNMPDGRLGIVSKPEANGNVTVRLYTLTDNGTRMVWDRDYAINVGAGWWNDNHGATSDGRYLYLLRHAAWGDDDYKVIDLFTGEVALDGSQYTLYQQGVHNSTSLTTDPLTGDIYFFDHEGSHVARASRTNGATREAVVEYGANGVTLTAPLLTTQANVAKPDVFVTDTRDIQVRVGNTAPSVSHWSAPAVNEDGSLTFTASQFTSRFTDPELDTLQSITLVTVPTTGQGTLSLNGTTLEANAVVQAGDLDKLVFKPALNFNGSVSFSYTASDGFLSSSSNTDASKRTATVSISVTAVNDAPVLDTSATPSFAAINEDELENAGTQVSDLVADGSITDPDVGTAPEAIAVTKVDNTHGVWQYKVGSGNWTAFSPSTGQMVDLGTAAVLLDATDRIRFVPGAHVNSTANGSPSISFRAWDKTSGVAGGTTNPNAAGGNTAVSSTTDTASLTIHAVNDAPTTASKTVTMDEDTTRAFSAADFSFADVDGDSMASVTLQLPSHGQLLLNGVVQTGAVTVAAANLGTLAYRPAADAFGAAYATIEFTVSDGTASSGTAILTFNVTDTNDAPTAVKWVSTTTTSSSPVPENSAQGTVVGKLTATDPNTGDTFTFVRVSNPNFNIAPDGTVTVAANAIIDFERTPTQTLRVRVTDSGGLTYEQDLTVTLGDVVEDAPSLIVNSLYVGKGETVTITESQLKARDSVQADSQLTYTVLTAPAGGTWWIDSNGDGLLNNSEMALGPVNEANPNGVATFTHADVVAGKLKFKQDGSQSNSLLSVSLSDGTAASVDADGNPLVTGTLVAIVSSPPVVSPVDDQQWKTSGAQTFTLPAGTFTDPDYDLVTVTATLDGGAALPSWLSFNPATLTFSGEPSGYTNNQFIDIKISGTDNRAGAGRPVTDVFRITFKDTITAPTLVTPIADHTFDGAGAKSYAIAKATFAAQDGAGNAISSYTAQRWDPAANSGLGAWVSLSGGWLSFSSTDATNLTFTGNPPANAAPGPYLLKVTATTVDGFSTSSAFKLFVTNSNDAPVEAAPDVRVPDRTIADANEHSWTIPSNAFTDGDGDTLTLRAGDVDGNELPSWVRFDPATRTFSAKAPSGSGALTVRLFADDGQGASGFADFTITYSGGMNVAPSVMTPDGIYTMDGRGDLNLAATQKAERFSLAHKETATITKDHLKELDPDDDGTGLTYTVTTLPRYGQLWLDTDGDGTINGAEVALNTGGTFTQADIDSGKLKYRNTDNATATGGDPPDDSFVFNLADGGEDGALAVKGAIFNIQVTPKPASPTLQSVLRSTATTAVTSGGITSYVTNDDTVTFKLVFSENVRGVDASDFALTGSLKDLAQITGISAINASTYTVTVGSKTGTSGIANANGTLGLELAGTPTIKNTAQTPVSLSTESLQATVNNEVYTLDNTGPTATLSAQPLHDGSTAFWVTIDFGSSAINDLTLADLVVSHGSASQLQRISINANVDPNTQPANFNPLTDTAPTPEGNRYRVLITPTSGTNENITVELVAGGVTNTAGNGNASASVRIDRNSLPTLKLDAAPTPQVANRSATFTEVNGADNGSAAVAFTTAGPSLADADASQNLASLKIAFTASQITDGAAESLRVTGATSGGSIALNFANGAAISNVVLNGTTYSVTASVASGTSSLSFAKANGSLLTLAEAEALLDALRYNNSSNTPTVASREFNVSVNDGLETSSPATFTVTVAATNDSPVITDGALDSATASLTETDTGLRASGTLSVQDLDTSQTVAISKVSVLASGTGPAANRPNETDLLAMLTIDNGASTPGSTVIGNTSTTGTAYWVFNSGSTSFDYLAAGETLVLTYTVRATDNGSTTASGEQTITVTITGTNDKPTIATSAVTALSATSAPMTASGTVNVSDPDVSNLLTGTLGSPSITATRSGSSLSLDPSSETAILNALTFRSTFTDANVVTVDSFTVNEGNNAVWRITYAGSTTLSLSIGGTATAITDFGKLQYSLDGTTWTDYTWNIALTGSGTLFARVPVVNDQPLSDPAETIVLTATTSTGTRVSGTATIREADADAGSLSINSFDVNEGSNALWTIRAAAESTVTFALSGSATTGTDYSPLEVSTNGTDWIAANTATVPTSGIVYARVAVSSENLASADAGETIVLAVTSNGTTINGTAIIREGYQTSTSAPVQSNPGNVAWSFSLDPTVLKDSSNAALQTGDKVSFSYPLTMTDNSGQTSEKPLKFTVVMTSQTAGVLIVGGDAGSIVEGSPGTLSASDAITFDGAVATNTPAVSVLSIGKPGSSSLSDANWALSGEREAIRAGFSVVKSGVGVTWTYSVSESTLDFLNNGDTVTAVFRVFPDNNTSNTVYRDITIVISGTNDAPIITSAPAAAVGSVVEAGFGVAGTNATTPQTLTASDVDAGAVLTWSVTGQAADASLSGYTHSRLGTYGRVYLNAQTGAWTYVLDNTAAATQALASGQSVVDNFVATVSDGTATAAQQIRVTVTGSNDAPVLTQPTNPIATYADTSAYDSFSTPGNPTGSLAASDAEGGSLTYAIADQVADTSLANFTHSVTGHYGKLYLNALTGAYQYVRDTAKMNAATTSVTDNFTLQVTDSLGATSNTATLTVAVNGVNDTPTLAPRARSGSSTFYLDETNSGLTVSNTLVAGEIDSSQTLTVSVPTATVKLNSGDAQDMSDDQKKWLTLTSGTASGTSLPINWTFNSGNEAFNDLKPGDTLTFAYTVRVSDGALQAESTITVVVRGTNDAPVISVSAGDAATASRTETDAALTATGKLSVSDAEAANTLTASVAGVSVHSSSTASSGAIPTEAALKAMMTVAPSSSADGATIRGTNALTWTFNSGSQTFNALAAGETLVLDYTVRVTDNDNGMATQTVTVTITGTNDAPTITVVDTSGAISSGFPDRLFDSGSITFTDLDVSDRPTATLAVSSITGTNRSNASLTLTDSQKATIASGLSISPFGSSVTVDSFQVAEGSDAVWTIQATPNSTLLLTLGGTATATNDYGSLMVSTNGGTSWAAYGAGVNVPSNGLVMAKVAVVNDGSTETAETLLLNVKPLVGDAVNPQRQHRPARAAEWWFNR